MKLLITGGLGFIGSNFIRSHLSKFPKDLLLNIDKITYAGNPLNLKEFESNPSYQFVKGDIADPFFIKRVFNEFKPDIVANFAAESHVDRSILSSEDFIRTNVVGVQTLLDEAKTNKVARFIQISTDEVYGSLESKGYFTEASPLKPNNPYSASKASGDLLALSYFKTHQFPVIVTRCSNNYGPYQFPEKLIPLMISKALQDKSIPVYGDGLNIRDWIHVQDHCDAIEEILKKGKEGEVYNIGSENEMTNLDLVKMTLDVLGKPHSLIQFVKDRPGHDRRYATDAAKLRRLGWNAKISFEEGITQTIEWYSQNSEWLLSTASPEFKKYLEVQYEQN